MRTYLPLLLFLLPTLAFGQFLRTVVQLPSQVNETSGIELTGDNAIWTFNDSGGEDDLYKCDTLGNLLKSVDLVGAWNRDWEDLAQDDQGNMYVGNIGNNSNSNTDLTIFKIPNPDLAGSSVSMEVIYYSYEDQNAFPPADPEKNFDCEAMFWWNGNIYLCSKNRTVPFDGMTYLYRLPDTPGTHVAMKIDEFDTEGFDTFNNWITAADISPDGSKVCLLSSDKMWVLSGFTGDQFFSGTSQKFNFPSSTQKEAIVFKDNNTVYITDEDWGNEGRNLYEMELSTTQQEGPYAGQAHLIPGKIEAEEYDLGSNGSAYYDLGAGNQGGEFRSGDVDIQACTDIDGGYNVGWFEAGEWLQYTIDVQFTGDFDVSFRTAGQFNGTVYIEVDQVKQGESLEVTASGDWQLWQTVSLENIAMTQGEHEIRIVMESGGFNFNHVEFTENVTGYDHSASVNQITVFPNPVNDVINVEGYRGDLHVSDLLGQSVETLLVPNSGIVDVSFLHAGVYNIEMNGVVVRLVKE